MPPAWSKARGPVEIDRASPFIRVIEGQTYIIMQHIGMPFIIMQQVMPGIIMPIMQSQHAWIIFSPCLSPLVQVTVHPISVISTLHIPIMPTLHMHIGIPFIITQHEHIPFCIIIIMF
jgi:hypothetical protein